MLSRGSLDDEFLQTHAGTHLNNQHHMPAVGAWDKIPSVQTVSVNSTTTIMYAHSASMVTNASAENVNVQQPSCTHCEYVTITMHENFLNRKTSIMHTWFKCATNTFVSV